MINPFDDFQPPKLPHPALCVLALIGLVAIVVLPLIYIRCLLLILGI